jgi:hypothetical protein
MSAGKKRKKLCKIECAFSKFPQQYLHAPIRRKVAEYEACGTYKKPIRDQTAQVCLLLFRSFSFK